MKKYFILLVVFLILPLLNADIISINSGGSENIIINPDRFIEGFFFRDTSFCGIEILNPESDVDENANPILFSITTCEIATSCEVSIDGKNNIVMDTEDNLDFNYSQSMNNGFHNVIFYCTDIYGNAGTSSLLTFYIYLITGGGPGSLPPYTPPELSNLSVFSEEISFYYDYTNEFLIETFDALNHRIDVDELSIELINDLKWDLKIYREDVGIYFADIEILEETDETLIFNITASQDINMITKEVRISIIDREPKFIEQYWCYLLILFILFIILFLFYFYYREKKKSKNKYI